MSTKKKAVSFFLYSFFYSSSLVFCSPRDTMEMTSPLTDNHGDSLISAGESFELGFFTPNETTTFDNRRYVGIWYYGSSPKTVVWVANRDDPVLGFTGTFRLAGDGNIEVLDGNGRSHWRTNIEEPSLLSLSSMALKLMDDGNLILFRTTSSAVVWQSFDFPTDTFLPGMRMNENVSLTSWRNPNDPAPGNFSFETDQEEPNQYIVWKRSIRYWKSGVSGKFITSDDMPYAISYLLSNFTSSITRNDSVPYITSSLYVDTRLIMSPSGQVQYLKRDTEMIWSLVWAEPRDRCSVYNTCGNFGSCNDLYCKCLPGFVPASPDFWNSGEFSGGCVRKTQVCGKMVTSFLSLKGMKVGKPDSELAAEDEDECRRECVNNCQCQAYSYRVDGGSGLGGGACWIWTESLNNLQEDYIDGRDLQVRISASDIVESTSRSCRICGTNPIPYPLSTEEHCGDPLYRSFSCNISSGQISFDAPSGSYRVIQIDPNSRRFFIKPTENILQLDRSSPLHMTRKTNGTSTKEVEIVWDPPPEPSCTTSADCKDWPNSACNETSERTRRCVCDSNFRWDPVQVNCTRYKNLRGRSTEKMSQPLIFAVIFTGSIVIAVMSIVILYFRVQRRNAAKKLDKLASAWRNSTRNGSERHLKSLIDSGQFKDDDTKGIEVPSFDLETILAATKNFANCNKLGQGGFGPVYKGEFPGGESMAVKRLSSFSGQGFEEFKNEVVLIAKLQHRNLVRLLGYCVEGDEKMLLYEYMPNKSLDSFIFDRKLSASLDWNARFKIIIGIARGLLYLHQDSRLRIIHRDLKTSNILLDEDMNPKISDFGLARIFGGKETAETTNRVVGTYGYMSPEYALDGFFSVKSDVFSFGVVLLETISGKRNTGFYYSEQAMSLLGYTWLLWKEGKTLELLDKALGNKCNPNEYLKCVNIGLLCVQEDPNDRPAMSNILSMLGSETATLPIPKQPAFVFRRCPSSRASSSSKHETWSHNDLTVTLEDGR